MGLHRLPALADDIKDPLTGGVAPAGRRYRENDGTVANLRIPAFGAAMRPTGRAIVEIADMWQPGNGDMGLTPTLDGRILPSIDHVRCVIPLTDVMGAMLDESDVDREAFRRSWYATQMRSAPRLTPVHHIIGHSDPGWHGSMPASLAADRDAWRSLLWEPEALAKLMATYAGLYDLNWEHLPEGRILAPLEKRLKVQRDNRRAEATIAALRVRRAKAEIKTLSALAVAVKRGDKKTAEKHWKQFGAISENYAREAARCDTFAETPLEATV